MPRIPTADNQARLSPLRPAQSRPSPVGQGVEALGNAAASASRTLLAVREQEQLKADQAAFMEADRVLGEREAALLNDPQNGAFARRGKDALDITPRTLTEFDRAASEAEQELKTDRQRLAFRQATQNRRQTVQRQLQTHEMRERESFYAAERDAYKSSAASEAVTNYTDAGRIEQSVDKIRAAIDQTPGLSAEQRATELGERRSGVYAGVIDRYLANDAVAAAERYYGTIKDRVNGEKAADIERAIRAAKDRQEAKRDSGLALARQELSDQVRDIESAFRLRIPVTSIPSEATFVALHGERGRKLYQQTKLMADASVDAAKMTQLPTDEVARIAAGYTPTQVAGAAPRAEVAGIIQQQARYDLKEREDDPAGYLLRHSPTVQEAWQEFQTGGDVGLYVKAVKGEQDRLKLPTGDLLPDEYATQIASSISQADAEGMTNLIQSEAQKWGDAWPDVYGQIAPKLSDIAAVIGSGIPKHAADALASTAGLKTNELSAMIPPGTTLKDVRDTVAGEFADFARSFPVSAARTVGAFNDSAVRLTAKYMQQGMGKGDAAARAYEAIAGNYTLNDFRNVTYRVPRSVDADSVEEAATDYLSEFTAVSGDIDTSGSPFPEESLLVNQTQYIRENAYWMTSPDESGLRLYVDGGPVISQNRPVEYTWQQLTQKAIEWREKEKAETIRLREQAMRARSGQNADRIP